MTEKEGLIRGNRRLAEALRVHRNTVSNWKRSGQLDPAIVTNIGRTTVYDITKLAPRLLSFRQRSK